MGYSLVLDKKENVSRTPASMSLLLDYAHNMTMIFLLAFFTIDGNLKPWVKKSPSSSLKQLFLTSSSWQ